MWFNLQIISFSKQNVLLNNENLFLLYFSGLENYGVAEDEFEEEYY